MTKAATHKTWNYDLHPSVRMLTIRAQAFQTREA